MKTILSALAIAATLFSGMATANAVDVPTPDYGPGLTAESFTPDELAAMNPASADPQEDEPGWDCRIHGNKLCEPPLRNAGLNINFHPYLEEDEPGWNCYLDGNRVCGPDTAGLESDAWSKFTPAVLPQWILDKGFKAEYMGTMQSDAPYLSDSWHTYHPSSIPGYVHVFSINF